MCLILIAVFCGTVFTVPAQRIENQTVSPTGQLDVNIDTLMRAEDFATEERSLLRSLPVDSIPVFIDRLEHVKNKDDESRLMLLLSTKLVQFKDSMSETTKQAGIDALVEKCRNATGIELRSHIGNLERLDSPKIDNFIASLSTSQSPDTRLAAAALKEKRQRINKSQ